MYRRQRPPTFAFWSLSRYGAHWLPHDSLAEACWTVCSPPPAVPEHRHPALAAMMTLQGTVKHPLRPRCCADTTLSVVKGSGSIAPKSFMTDYTKNLTQQALPVYGNVEYTYDAIGDTQGEAPCPSLHAVSA